MSKKKLRNKKYEEVQLFGTEMKEALELIEECNIDNVIHAAKIPDVEKHTSD